MRDSNPPQKPGLDPLKKPGSGPSERLLDELKSIKDLLDKDVANEQIGATTGGDIPLLDDPVADLQPQPPLLDIDGIFRDDPSDDNFAIESDRETSSPAFQFPKFTLDVAISDDPPSEPATQIAAHDRDNIVASMVRAADPSQVLPAPSAKATAAGPTRSRRDYNRELLIQELVDEFIPQIEAALHERLNRLDNDALLALKNND